MDRRSCYKDLLPFVALVANECSNTGLFTLFKAATLKGMSDHVFVAYAYAVATIVLLPISFCYRRLVWFATDCLLQIINKLIWFHTCLISSSYFVFHVSFADQEWLLYSVSPSYQKLLFLG